MENKTNQPLLFEAGLNWLQADCGVVYGKGCNGTIRVNTPAAFGGMHKDWSPEHLFLSAIISCYMATFTGLAKKTKLIIQQLECRITGEVRLVNGHYQFTHIDIWPEIIVESKAMLDNAWGVAHKTEQYCLISHSINATVTYHTAIYQKSDEVAMKTTAVAE